VNLMDRKAWGKALLIGTAGAIVGNIVNFLYWGFPMRDVTSMGAGVLGEVAIGLGALALGAAAVYSGGRKK
jgi:hypothetical protein